MVWYFIGVYIINRTSHGRLEIRNFCSRVEKNISLVSAANEWNIFQHSKKSFASPRGHINTGYYTVARRYEFYFRVAKQYFTNERSEWVKYSFCHSKIKFISSSRRVMFFLLYRLNDIDKVVEGNYQDYVIDNLTCEFMENKPLGSRM